MLNICRKITELPTGFSNVMSFIYLDHFVRNYLKHGNDSDMQFSRQLFSMLYEYHYMNVYLFI